jgi:uncharacterized repeat protein (TIGR01451 family)
MAQGPAPAETLPREAYGPAAPSIAAQMAAGAVAADPSATGQYGPMSSGRPTPGTPVPYAPIGPWTPPGMSQPGPRDEYLVDGGDRGLPAEVGDDWEVRGLETEDTIAHYDTIDGRTVVEPSNQVHIYAPRFGSVRRVVSLRQNQQVDMATRVHLPTKLNQADETQIAATSTKNLQPGHEVGRTMANLYRGRQFSGAASSAVGPEGFDNAFKPYENLKVIRQGIIEGSESAWLAEGIAAAAAWTHKQAVQIILDRQAATESVQKQNAGTLFSVDAPPGYPTLRVIKVASTAYAEPGDVIDFTIRFDNTGTEPIGNVTIIDNLTTRLEYIPDSAQCSLQAEFFTQPNEGDSLTLRCEVADPLEPGEGGIVRFKCRVR